MWVVRGAGVFIESEGNPIELARELDIYCESGSPAGDRNGPEAALSRFSKPFQRLVGRLVVHAASGANDVHAPHT
jgi:hypothetical protein